MLLKFLVLNVIRYWYNNEYNKGLFLVAERKCTINIKL